MKLAVAHKYLGKMAFDAFARSIVLVRGMFVLSTERDCQEWSIKRNQEGCFGM